MNAAFSCQDDAGGSGIASCTGTVPNDQPITTATIGAKSFTVTATDNAGNAEQVSHGYTVVDVTDPTVTRFSVSTMNAFGPRVAVSSLRRSAPAHRTERRPARTCSSRPRPRPGRRWRRPSGR